MPQNAAPVSTLADGRRKGPQHEKAIPRQIADETGLSVDTVRRALKPAPVANLVSVKEAETDEEAIIREANAIVAAWNRARQQARELALKPGKKRRGITPAPGDDLCTITPEI